MLLRSGLNDVYKIPVFLENAGISQTVISSLSLPVNKNMEKESVIASDDRGRSDPFCRNCLKRFIIDLQSENVSFQDYIGGSFPLHYLYIG